MRNLLAVALAACLMTAVACGSGGRRAAETPDRMTVMEQYLARLSADIAVLQHESRNNAEALAQLRQLVNDQLEELRTGSARNDAKLERIENALLALTERVEDSELRLTNIRQELRGLQYSRYSPSTLQPGETGEEADPAEPGGQTGEQAADTVATGQEEAYQTAYGDFLRGDYDVALSGLREFLRAFPDVEKADDAQYYVGECLYNLGAFEAAVEEYDALIINFPDSQFRVSATYKKALSFLNSNQTAQGVILLQQLIRRYPDSNEARLAREQLRSLGLNP